MMDDSFDVQSMMDRLYYTYDVDHIVVHIELVDDEHDCCPVYTRFKCATFLSNEFENFRTIYLMLRLQQMRIVYIEYAQQQYDIYFSKLEPDYCTTAGYQGYWYDSDGVHLMYKNDLYGRDAPMRDAILYLLDNEGRYPREILIQILRTIVEAE